MENIYRERIEALRAVMERNGWDAVVVSGSDPHSSEYPAPRWQQVKFLSGFTGEAGDIVVTMDHAGLWTDSRYFIQAVTQLEGTGWNCIRPESPGLWAFLNGFRTRRGQSLWTACAGMLTP